VTTLLVVSDTHDDLSFVASALRAHPEVDRIVHLGDHCDDAVELEALGIAPVSVVRGNGDTDCPHGCPLDAVLTVEGHRLLLTHGHRQDVKLGLERLAAFARLQRPPVDAVLFGHTHRPLWRLVGGDGTHPPLLLANPGSARVHAFFGTAEPSALLLRVEAGAGSDGLSAEWLLPG
jgi:uncharacterized protein